MTVNAMQHVNWKWTSRDGQALQKGLSIWLPVGCGY